MFDAWIVFTDDGTLFHCEPTRLDRIGVDPAGLRWSILSTRKRWIGPIPWADPTPDRVLEQISDWWEIRKLMGDVGPVPR